MIRLIFIGEHFYRDSSTIMSTIYTETGDRYDYGYIQRDLASGEEITIRQANQEEKEQFEKLLIKLKKRKKIPL